MEELRAVLGLQPLISICADVLILRDGSAGEEVLFVYRLDDDYWSRLHDFAIMSTDNVLGQSDGYALWPRERPPTEVHVIRAITRDDSATVTDLTVASGLFSADEAGMLDKMMAEYFAGNADEGHSCVIDEEDEPLGVAYYQPKFAADRVWDLTLIAVRSDCQGQGHGAALMRHVEDTLRADGQRLLLVETSGMPDFELTRNFYEKLGYQKEARIRDFYAVDDDMIIFRKVLEEE